MSDERKHSLAEMRRQIKEAKRREARARTPSQALIKVLDYMANVVHEADTETRRQGKVGIYHAIFTIKLAELVGSLAEEWTT